MLGAVPSACSASTWATLTRSMRVAPLFQQTLGGLKVGVDRRLAAHGFDEFFGNLYHLNAEEEPTNPDYPTEEEAPLLRAALLPRGVIHSWVTDTDTDEVDPRYGPVGKQRVEDTGPLNRKRMETIDDETTAACVDFIRRQHASGTPFSCG
jgi:arylsulfatase A-like enzyme